MEEVLIQNQKQLCDCSAQMQLQDIWRETGREFRTESRRRDIVVELLKKSGSCYHIDIGCAEGYITSSLERVMPSVVAFDVNLGYLKKAKKAVTRTEFCLASITDLPIPDSCAESISVLEVLEHLPMDVIHKGIAECDRILKNGGCLLVSVPYKQRIRFGRCEKCGKWRPTNEAWHIHSFDQTRLQCLLPDNYHLDSMIKGPNFPVITCSRILSQLPTDLWLQINNLVGHVRLGPYIFVKYLKE